MVTPTVGAITLGPVLVDAESAFTVAHLRDFISTALTDGALQLYLDAAIEDVDDVLGPLTIHERIRTHGPLLPLVREAESITSVVDGRTTLAADDYELSDSGRVLRRVHDGTNPAHWWSGRVDVTYVREDPVASRWRAVVELVRLELAFTPGLVAETIGTWSATYAISTTKPYADQRADILASLTESDGIR